MDNIDERSQALVEEMNSEYGQEIRGWLVDDYAIISVTFRFVCSRPLWT